MVFYEELLRALSNCTGETATFPCMVLLVRCAARNEKIAVIRPITATTTEIATPAAAPLDSPPVELGVGAAALSDAA